MPRAVICEWQGDKLNCWAIHYLSILARPGQQSEYASVKYPANLQLRRRWLRGKSPENRNLVAILAKRRAGRQAVFTRTEDFIGTHHRIGYLNYNKMGVKRMDYYIHV
jgi:hypothetical protein